MTGCHRQIALGIALALVACTDGGKTSDPEGAPDDGNIDGTASATTAGEHMASAGAGAGPTDSRSRPSNGSSPPALTTPAAVDVGGRASDDNFSGDEGLDGLAEPDQSSGIAPGGAPAGSNMSGPAPQPRQTPSNEGDAFEAVGTNPFVFVAHDPFSTFAADVDTASYDLFRRDVERGVLPRPDSVRLEEYVNNFKYDYPAPSREGDDPFEISLAAASGALGGSTTLLRVGIQGKKPADFEKKRTNLVFLIDTSGSMKSAQKLPLVQSMLTLTLDFLDPTDTVSIVTYAGGTRVALEPTAVSEKDMIGEVINSFTAGGSTAGASGITLAYQQAETGFIQSGINHVILCTDGDFNVGASSDAALVTLIEEKRRSGVTLTTLGFGTGNLNDSMMEKVSNAGNGIYSVISSAQHAETYVAERMLSTLEHIAKDVKIQVEFNPEHVLAYRLLGYENRAIADDLFRDDTVDAGEIGAGHRVTALYELVMSGDEVPNIEGAPAPQDGDAVDGEREIGDDDLVLLKVRSKPTDAGETDPASEVQASLARADILNGLPEADDDLSWAVAIAGLAEILKGSPYANEDALPEIEAITRAQAERDTDRGEFVTLLDRLLPLLQ